MGGSKDREREDRLFEDADEDAQLGAIAVMFFGRLCSGRRCRGRHDAVTAIAKRNRRRRSRISVVRRELGVV